ncbi:hypothetical protein Sinac_6041 [Singulisphaera acidiphila DSM 18658]|uniref:Uncharacterized protein n=1 Tax=Singulisphaera acidiphila (strain ATCC BAA-1392 / DSM 18658 / VKM B-2454 / MOB10) TaxID=886293 RepID=L0DN99_SINAD|nr:hypothetical protein Sinac_6041 [Singulisphaera acidiphila DSM 18658]
MDFSNRELKLIGVVQRKLCLYQWELITLEELVNGLLDEIANADADRVIPHCLAILPGEACSHLEACLARGWRRPTISTWHCLTPEDEQKRSVCQAIRRHKTGYFERLRLSRRWVVGPMSLHLPSFGHQVSTVPWPSACVSAFPVVIDRGW